MRNYDNEWEKFTPEEIPGKIITGANTVGDLKPSEWMLRQIMPQATVLDFGCGLGRNSFWLAKNYHNVTCFDLPNMIEELRKDERYCNFRGYMDVTDDWRKVRQGSYDVILAVLVLQHIPKDVVECYLDAFRVMGNHLLVHSRSYMDRDDGPVLQLLEKYFSIDENVTKVQDVNAARNCSGEDHFTIWMKPKQ